MSPSPLKERSGAVSLPTGKGLVIWGGLQGEDTTASADGAIYDVQSDKWSELPSSPLEGRHDAAGAFLDGKVLIYGGEADAFEVFGDGAVLDTETMVWQTMPASPLGPRVSPASVAVSGKWFIWGGFAGMGGRELRDGAIYEAGRWSVMASLPESMKAPYAPEGFWTGRELLLLGGELGVRNSHLLYGYEPGSGAWRQIRVPFLGDNVRVEALWAGDRLLVWGAGPPFEYLPESDEWRRYALESAFLERVDGSTVWTDEGLVVWGGSYKVPGEEFPEFANDGAVLRPQTSSGSDLGAC
ncbi:MAG TPA: hypothetical protein VHJ78_13180 [Actinomycetota bacterium]|nr:hypothetical protein [Actinomycetota bacterium]